MKKTATQTLPNMGLLPWVTIQCTLPHSRQHNPDGSEATRYERVNGGVRLVMFADPRIGLPYGKIPRLLLAYVVARYKRNRAHQSIDEARTIDLGPSWRALMRQLGMGSQGGPRGTYTACQEQAQRLFLSAIRREAIHSESAHQFQQQLMTSEGHLPGVRRRGTVQPRWSEDGAPPPHPKLKIYVRLSADFAKACEIAIPVDMDTMAALQAPFAIDLYAWLSYRSGKLHSNNEPYVRISWARLMEQFGHGYARTRDFRRAFRRQLRNVLEHYPARVDHQSWSKGIVLYAHPPHIERLPEDSNPPEPPPRMIRSQVFWAPGMEPAPDLESEPAQDAGSDPPGSSVPHVDVGPPGGVQETSPKPPAPGGDAPTPPRVDPTPEDAEGPRSDLDGPPDRPSPPQGVSDADHLGGPAPTGAPPEYPGLPFGAVVHPGRPPGEPEGLDPGGHRAPEQPQRSTPPVHPVPRVYLLQGAYLQLDQPDPPPEGGPDPPGPTKKIPP